MDTTSIFVLRRIPKKKRESREKKRRREGERRGGVGEGNSLVVL